MFSSARHLASISGPGIGRDPQRREDVRAARVARGRTVSVLDDRHAARRRDDRRGRRDVHRARTVAAGPARVEQAVRSDPALPSDHPAPHGPDGPFQLVGRLAADPHGGQERRRDRLGDLAVQQGPDGAFGLVGRERRAARDRLETCERQDPSRQPDRVPFDLALGQAVEADRSTGRDRPAGSGSSPPARPTGSPGCRSTR